MAYGGRASAVFAPRLQAQPANLLRSQALKPVQMTLTATADAEAPLVPPAEAPARVHAPERPVFAATTPTRPRVLKLAGRVTAGLVALWLVALLLGTFGFGPVAGIGLPRIGGDGPGGRTPEPARESAPAAPRAAPATPARDPPRAPPAAPHQRVPASGVTLTTRYGRPGASAAARHGSA